MVWYLFSVCGITSAFFTLPFPGWIVRSQPLGILVDAQLEPIGAIWQVWVDFCQNEWSAHLAGSMPFTSAALYCLTFVTIAVYWCLTVSNHIRPHSPLFTLKLNSNSKLQMALVLITKYQCSIILSDINSAIHQKHFWQMVQSPAHFLCLEQLHNHRKCSRTEFCSSTVHNHLFLFWHSFVLNSVLKRTAQSL